MYCAIYKAPIQVWKLLISFGANLNIKSTYDQNILHEYLDNNDNIDSEVIKLILNSGFNKMSLDDEHRYMIQ